MVMAEIVVNADGVKHVHHLVEGKPLFVGRVVEADICLPSPAVSRRHAVFLAKNGECGVKDMGSANGTFLNGRRITRAMRLKNGDRLTIAGFAIEFNATGDREEDGDDGARHTTIFHNPAPAASRAEMGGLPLSTPEGKAPPLSARVTDRELEAAAEEDLTPAFSHEESAAEAVPVVAQPVRRKSADTTIAPAAAIPPAPPPPPPKPELRPPSKPLLAEEAYGDGDGDADAAFLPDEADADDGGERENALAKAAAEAGIVGEFAPDTEEDAAEGVATPAAPPAAPEAAPDAMPLDESFRQAIEARLALYSFLDDLKRERDQLRASIPNLPDAVKSELSRQDREMDKIPSPEQADGMIEKRLAKQAALVARVEEAKKAGEPLPPRPSRHMKTAEELAISQWTLCAQSGREVLPAVFHEGFRIMADEPLADELRRAGMDPTALMGGAAYCLALEILQEETKFQRQDVRARRAALPQPGEKRGGLAGLFGKAGSEAAPAPGDAGAELEELDAHLASRAAWINQEAITIEKRMIDEFWRVYGEAALHFVPKDGEMPLPIRAFLRHGVVGMKKWWLKQDVRDFILKDCSENVVREMRVGRAITNILYADEYLRAVLDWKCTPALDENLEINERNSPNWKADKALRRLIKSRSEGVLLEELIETLSERVDRLGVEADAVEDKLSKLLIGSKNYKATKNELGQQRQAIRVETSKLNNLRTKIREETLASLRETEAEVRERFTSGELPKPSGEFLLRRECAAIRKIGRLLANLKERFMPLVLRDKYVIGTDAVNDRQAIAGEFAGMEGRDPAIFLETLVESKKKANRVDLRVSPVVVLVPSAGILAYSWNPRSGPEDGRLAVPTCFIRRRIRERQLTYLLADFRWDTSKAAAGMDIMTSDTIVAAFMTVRWDWRKRAREAREKGLIYTDQNDRTNWRRVYEAYMQTAYDGGKKLYNRNYDFYERVIGKYFDMPEGVALLRK